MRETLNVIPSECEGSAGVAEGIGKMSFRVIDSSLGVMLLLCCFFTKHSCVHSEWRLGEKAS